ncbi:MAG: tetratricopeptide repeat protein [Rubrivivax sp.]
MSPSEPDAHIPGDRRRALAAGVELPDRVEGAALFADISGFTPLTELLALELGPQRGAEHVTAHLNRVFGALISTLGQYGGEVIYFSGDAITCWLDGDDGLRATACGLAMQSVMQTHGELVTPAGTLVTLGMKVAVAVGIARRFVVGDPRIQRIDILAGRLVDALAEAEHLARAGEVVLDSSALNRLAGAVDIAEVREDHSHQPRVGVVAALTRVPRALPASPPAPALPGDVTRQWLLPAIYDRVAAHRGEFLSELRPAYPMFVRFGGIDYDRDPDAIGKLDRFIRHVQRIVTSLGGNCLHLTLGDKGAYLYVVFGAPIAHEDDAARVATAALRVRELPATTDVVDVQIGLTYGRVHSSTYGHPQRQVYTCFGDAVNIAARLMMAAPPGAIYATETLPKATGTAFQWAPLPPVVVKGKSEPIAVFALATSTGLRHAASESEALPLIGRRAELAVLRTKLDQTLGAHGQVVSVTAEAGMGKSRLLGELARLATSRGLLVASGDCQAFGTSTAYFPWRPIWQALLGVDASAAPAEQIDSLTKRLMAIDAALLPRLPLLGALVGVPVPGNALTEGLDAKFRKASLEDLLNVCWRALVRAVPRVVIVEDAHWIDELSQDLLALLAKSSLDLPVLIAMASRPRGPVDPVTQQVAALPNYTALALTELDSDHVVELARAKVAQMTTGRGVASTELVEMVTRRANGNPFYVEELLNFIASRGIEFRDDRAWRELDLPDSLHSVILGRIDTVDEEPRRTLKVASVIGRTFAAPALPGAYPELGTPEEVLRQLVTLTTADLIFREATIEQTYAFKHSLTQEVTYESLPFGFRTVLHERVAAYIERSEPDAIDRNLDLLTHHYWHTENLPKKREYLHRAGMAAQAAYANTSAIDYYEKLAGLVEGPARVDALLKLGAVLDLTGNWRRAEDVDREALSLASRERDRTAEGWCETALAEVVRKQGQYDRALDHLARAETAFGETQQRAGLGRVLHLRGTLAGQRGDFEAAAANFRNSLAIREALNDGANMANLLSNLGVIAEYRGDYRESSAFHERAMALRTDLGDRRGIAVSMTNIGTVAVLEQRFSDARRWFEQFNVLAREVGDAWMIGNGENNLGNALRGLGDYAATRPHYATSLRRFAQLEDPWALAYLAEDIALLAALTGDARDAYRLLGGADRLRDSIGSPRPPTRETELMRDLASAGSGLPSGEREQCREAGRRLDLAALVALAGQVCAD